MLRRNFLYLGFPLIFPSPCSGNEEIYDSVIAGAGCAGLTSASLLAELGHKKILVLESEPLLVGSSAICGGQWAVSGTHMQRDTGIKDSEGLFLNDMMEVGRNKNDRCLVHSFVKASTTQYNWVIRKGVKPKSLAATAGMSVPRAHIFDPKEILAMLIDCCESQGIPINCGVRVLDITKDPQGYFRISVAHNAEQKIIKSKTVILSTGGFSRNKQLIRKYAPSMENIVSFSGVGSRGDGLAIALSLGAATADIENIKASFGFCLNATGTKQITGVFYAGAIIVNEHGERFVNESLPNKLIGDAAQRYGKGSFIVFDEPIRKKQMELRPNDNALLKDIGDIGRSVLMGSSLIEVARKAGINGDSLVETVNSYNKRINNSEKDPLGRDSLSSGWGKCVPIKQPPFYVVHAISGITGTYGGVKVDHKARVIATNGQPIEGLYAAGEIIGGVHGDGFMAGTAFAKANALGRISAESVAEYVG